MTAGEETGQVQRSRVFATWFLWGSVVTILLVASGFVLWRLPHWAPLWIARHSPSLDYILWTMRQETYAGIDIPDILVARAWEWEGALAHVMRERWESGKIGRSDWEEFELLNQLCEASAVESGAQERRGPVRGREAFVRFREQSRDDLLAACLHLLERPEVEFREQAAINLGHLRDPRAIPSLIRRLDDIQIEVSEKVAAALQAIGDPSVIPALIAYARAHPARDPRIYVSAATAIVDPMPEEFLIDLIESPSDWARHTGLLELARRRTSASLPALVRLAVDRDTDNARRARRVLQLTLQPQEFALLKKYLHDEDVLLRRGALQVLVDIGLDQELFW